MSSQVNISVFPVWAEVQTEWFYFLASWKAGQKKITLSLFFQNVTFQHILSVYFVSSLEMEIRYMHSLNNAQHYRLINRFYFYALQIHAENCFHQRGFFKIAALLFISNLS